MISIRRFSQLATVGVITVGVMLTALLGSASASTTVIGRHNVTYKGKVYGQATVYISSDKQWVCAVAVPKRVYTHTRMYRYISELAVPSNLNMFALRRMSLAAKKSRGLFVVDAGPKRLGVKVCLLREPGSLYILVIRFAVNPNPNAPYATARLEVA